MDGAPTRTEALRPAALRMRATPSLASPGDEVVVELFRGEEYYGDLPEDLVDVTPLVRVQGANSRGRLVDEVRAVEQLIDFVTA